MPPSPEGQIQFLVRLQWLLAEGQFIATDKYALPLALADISVEHGDDSGAPLTVPTSTIAEKFIQLYWRHASRTSGASKQSCVRSRTWPGACYDCIQGAGELLLRRSIMQWNPGGTSSDIEDRRGESGGGGLGLGGGGFGGIHLGIGGMLVLLILSFIFKVNLLSLFTGSTQAPATRPYTGETYHSGGEQREVQFVSFVLDDVQNTWARILPQAGRNYRHTKLVLFRDYTNSSCGTAQSTTGPFYCPEDEKVYIDLGFYDELKSRFGAPGEFAQAYVLAHEIGHHVQHLLGVDHEVSRLQRPAETRRQSVKLELQADCLAGVWGHSTEERHLIDQSDVDAGLNAAAAVGDDRLQRMATGHVSRESFTHGSSAQRREAFRRGLDSGQLAACNSTDQ